jgi:hypothetical protein
MEKLYSHQDIQEFIEIQYLHPSALVFFGLFEETMRLDSSFVEIRRNRVFDIKVFEGGGNTITYRMQLTEHPKSYYSLAFHENPANREFEVRKENDKNILVMYLKLF